MTRKVFYSFHYKPDCWRVSKVRNIGAIEDNQPASDNDWETITKGKDPEIEKWIKAQMKGRTCTVVLIGQDTAGRKWINYEIRESWTRGMGLVGIHIHNISDHAGDSATKGSNPFTGLTVGQKPLTSIVKTYDPPYLTSKFVYDHIATNLEDWIDEAIKIRSAY